MDAAPALVAFASLAAAALLSLAALRAWHGWLGLRRAQILAGRPTHGAAIDLTALRARVKRLEAIASGLQG